MLTGLGGLARLNKTEESMKAVSPEGNEIIGTLDVVQGTARADVALRSDTLKIEYLGETEVDWDSQETKRENGERLFVCSRGKIWRASAVMRATRSQTPETPKFQASP